MRNSLHRYSKYAFGLIVFLIAFSSIHWIGYSELLAPGKVEAKVVQDIPVFDEETIAFDKANPHVRAVMDVQDRHTGVLMANPGIVGTGTGLTKDGRPAILVFAESYESAKEAVLPANIEDVPVIVKITGEIKALRPPSGRGNKEIVDPTARFDRPVQIGVSTGHPDITAGTIGTRVTDGSDVYALSNNHVYADANRASIGDNVLQPGSYDGGTEANDSIGTLFDFEPIKFITTPPPYPENTIDAAIALSSTGKLDNSTPSDGYGMPKSTTTAASINQKVKKYGRTTSLTKGMVYAINATIYVAYSSGVARFVNQIIITPGGFSAPGDSGSLIVVDANRKNKKNDRMPVGLLFAGSNLITVANPIDKVLERFDVTIDGE